MIIHGKRVVNLKEMGPVAVEEMQRNNPMSLDQMWWRGIVGLTSAMAHFSSVKRGSYTPRHTKPARWDDRNPLEVWAIRL